MNRQDLRTTLVASLFCMSFGSPALADDTDVFVGQLLNPGQPNVLFLFDTSGSMNSQVVVGQDYDPTVAYEGVCNTDRVFWSLIGAGQVLLPDCQLATYVNKDAFKCDAASDAFEVSGYYQDTYAQWDEDADAENSIWTSIVSAFSGDAPTGESREVDCESDNGAHGGTTGSADVYPTDGANGPWSENETPGFWDEKGGTYTFYSGNFLNYVALDRDTILDTRMEVLQDVATDLIVSLSDINVGLMRFSASTNGGQVLHEIANINSSRADLITIINALEPAGSTPLAESFFEASQYYAGRDVVFGLLATDHKGELLPSVPESYDADSGKYISPIVRECQRNFVVVLTDGQPVDDTEANLAIEGLPGFDGSCVDNCFDELANHLNTQDQIPGAGALSGDQTIETYVIGFATDQELLEAASTGTVPQYDDNGDVIVDPVTGDPVTVPGYFVANDTMQLMGAFDSILQAIDTASQSFASPAVSINTFDRFTNRDELYFAMFEPSELGQPHWDGNVKKYRLVISDGEMVIVDANGNPATTAGGDIAENAQSFWSAEVDGPDVTAGGVASRLSTERNVYTNLVLGSLTTQDNLVATSNDMLTVERFGGAMAVDEADLDELINFARGVDANGNARKILGDPLHSRPLVVSYGGDDIGNEDLTLFFTTNDGYFHAVDPNPADGTTNDLELFSFIPKDLLPNLPVIKENAEQAPGNFDKLYGLDGGLTRWIQGDDGDLQVDDGESLYVIFGMRRGGRNYYALNVTDRNNPRVAWTIEGGAGGDFDELGQTWGSAIVGKIRWAGTEKPVLIISGGYDAGQDNDDGASNTDTMGRAIFIVDAFTGQLLWTASGDVDASPNLYLENMTNSIPSDPRVLDVNQDGLIDRIYVGDTAAQMWRFDIFNDVEDDDATITGGRIADFGGDGAAGNRRFFYPPSVTRIVDERYGSFLAIAGGTGFRADPLGEGVSDRFYVLRDQNVFTPQVDEDGDPVYVTATEGDLLDISNDLSPTVDDLNSNDGWLLDLAASGEKSLSAAISADNRIFFTTYLPGGAPLTCDPIIALGGGRLYELELLSGAPVNYDDQPVLEDRYITLDQEGIPPAPVLVFTEPPCEDCDGDDGDDGDDGGDDPDQNPVDPTGCTNAFSTVTMVIGTQVTDPNICNAPVRTYWYQEDTDQ